MCNPETFAAMDSASPNLAVVILRAPPRRESESLRSFACILRDLQLQALRESPESFIDEYTDVSSQPQHYWQNLIEHHNGLIQIAFGISPSLMPSIWATAPAALQFDVIMDIGIPLAMAISFGPVAPDQGLSSAPPAIENSSDKESRFYGGLPFQVARTRGAERCHHLFNQIMVDRDEWLLEHCRAMQRDKPIVARFRTNIKAGADQDELLSLYLRNGWCVSKSRPWRQTTLAGSGEAALQATECRGNEMDEFTVVVEKESTLEGLERQAEKSRRTLGSRSARL